MRMTVLSFPPCSISLSGIFPNLPAPIREDSQIDRSLLHGEEARPVLFSTLWPSFTKEVVLDQT
jgi:hypothetical protein